MSGLVAGLCPDCHTIHPLMHDELAPVVKRIVVPLTPPHPQPPQLSEEHLAIDREIAHHEESIRALKTSRNALSLVTRLPPELLTKIFSFIVPAPTSYDPSPLAFSWIPKISHICKHWRDVALSSPSLWTAPNFKSSGWAKEMIKRSKMAQLTVQADVTYMTPKMTGILKEALQHSERVASLNLRGTSTALKPLVDIFLQREAPVLQDLTLSNNVSYYTTDSAGFYDLPAHLAKGVLPQLRHLELLKCGPSWSSDLFIGLRSLKIHDPPERSRPSVSQLIDALESMPHLESLDLQMALPKFPDEVTAPPPASRIIHLPSLSRLCVHDRTVETATLLNHISFPIPTAIELSSMGSSVTDDDFSTVISALSRHLNHIQAPRFLTVDHQTDLRVRYQISPDKYPGALYRTFPDLTMPKASEMDIEFTWRRYKNNSHHKNIRAFCKALPLMELRSLDVYQGSFPLTKQAWVEVFGHLPQLKEVHLHQGSGINFVKALEPWPHKGSKSNAKAKGKQRYRSTIEDWQPPSPRAFLALHTLKLDQVVFEYEDHPDYWFKLLLDTLMMRCHYKCPIQELHLTECTYIYDDEVGQLEEVVPTVTWDHVEMSGTDEFDDEDEDDYEDYGGMGLYDDMMDGYYSDEFNDYFPF